MHGRDTSAQAANTRLRSCEGLAANHCGPPTCPRTRRLCEVIPGTKRGASSRDQLFCFTFPPFPEARDEYRPAYSCRAVAPPQGERRECIESSVCHKATNIRIQRNPPMAAIPMPNPRESTTSIVCQISAPAACRPPRVAGRRPSQTGSRPCSYRSGDRVIPRPLRRTAASVPPCPRPSRSPDARPSSAASAAGQEADRCFSPGSLPLGAACSISALISPPISTKRPVTYIQVSNTITAPMLP
jgi:hypothetical protein